MGSGGGNRASGAEEASANAVTAPTSPSCAKGDGVDDVGGDTIVQLMDNSASSPSPLLLTTIPGGGATVSNNNNNNGAVPSIEDERASAVNHSEEESEAPNSSTDAPRFEPLGTQWRYGQAVFARYKKTPYFYSGNIATYLGAGLFMIVFDDGTLNYRVRREDIVLREYPCTSDSQDDDVSSAECRESSSRDNHHAFPKSKASPLKHAHQHWHSNSSIVHQSYMMVDFSISPPKQVALRDDGRDVIAGDNSESLALKRLECGVGYEDDSTQVSDSDESSEEDMSMTPWQQMTQTFGMGKVRPRASRRSSISSLSQVDRLSITGKGMNQILPSPKGLKQTIQDYLSRKTKKVQPSSVGSNVVLFEHIRFMEVRLRELLARYDKEPTFSTRVSFDRADKNGGGTVRAYGTIKARLANGDLEVITEDEQMISVQVFSPTSVDFLPSVKGLECQMNDLARTSKKLYAGRKVQVNLYPGSRFSGHGVITLELETEAMFNVLLQNRIRLMNVPADKLVPLKEKKKEVVTITEDQYLVCSNKAKVYIGDQVFVKCEGDYEGVVEEKIGVLNGVFSNKTAAVDFADGSTGYEIAPSLITKCKHSKASADMDVMSLKNAVLMQVSGAMGLGGSGDALEVGYQVKADHPRKASVETCVVIKKHPTTLACDVRFCDGTIAFEVYPSQMILDKVETADPKVSVVLREALVGDYVLAWSSRFGRYCSAKVAATTGTGEGNGGGCTSLYTIVFDYGEQKANVPLEKLAPIDLADALSPTQKLTNYSIDTIGFEISPVVFTVGEVVMARVHGSVQYYSGWVEAVREKERMCAVHFDSSEHDEHVPFSAIFSVDARNRFQSVSNRMGSSSGGTDRLSRFQDESAVGGNGNGAAGPGGPTGIGGGEEATSKRRRHSGGSVGSIIMSVATSIFRTKKEVGRLERRGSHLVTEIGAKVRRMSGGDT